MEHKEIFWKVLRTQTLQDELTKIIGAKFDRPGSFHPQTVQSQRSVTGPTRLHGQCLRFDFRALDWHRIQTGEDQIEAVISQNDGIEIHTISHQPKILLRILS